VITFFQMASSLDGFDDVKPFPIILGKPKMTKVASDVSSTNFVMYYTNKFISSRKYPKN
jgi:hypothetical protein